MTNIIHVVAIIYSSLKYHKALKYNIDAIHYMIHKY